MTDLTILYYTANRISPDFMRAVQKNIGKMPAAKIVTVCHQPIDFGDEVLCVGSVPPSIYQVYRNVLLAALHAKTTYVACCEDDSLYTPEHFEFRPPADVFTYNVNRWVLTRRLSDDGKTRVGLFYWRQRTQMAQLICRRDLLIETLEEKFAKYPCPPASHEIAKKSGWGEPGRYEKNLGLPLRTRAYFRTSAPNVTFNHSESLMGRRQVRDDDRICEDLEPWGNATELWERIHG